MSLLIPTLNGIPFARDSTEVNVIPDSSGVTGAASWGDGFPPETMIPINAGGTPPSGQDFNGIFNHLSAHQVWQNAGGLYPYNASLATAIGGYAVGAVVQGDDKSSSFINTVAGNMTNPNTGGAGWDIWVDRFQTAGWVNVQRFGAVADALMDPTSRNTFDGLGNVILGTYTENPNATDNTAAFQLALVFSAIQRVNLYVPPGFYWCAGTMYPQNMGIGPRRGQRIYSDASELGAIIGTQGVHMFDLKDTNQGSVTFEKIGMWARHRSPTVPYTVNDTSTCIINSKVAGNMRVRLNEVLFRYFETAVDASKGAWLSQIEKCEFINTRYGVKLKDSYAVYIKGNNFICGTAIHSPTSALLQCEISDNHFDIGTFTEVLDAEVKVGDVVTVPRTLRPYSTVDIATQGLDFNNNYFEIYGLVDPAHIVLDIHSQISDRSSFKETYINVGAKLCVLRRINSTIALTHAQSLTFEKTTLVATNPTTMESWWTFDPSLLYFFYEYDDVPKTISSNDNPLIPINQEHLRLYGTLDFDPNIATQKFDFSALTLPASNSYIGNSKLITATGLLNLKAGAYDVAITPLSLQASTVGAKTIDIEVNGLVGVSRARLFDGTRSTGLKGSLQTYISTADTIGTNRQIDLVCTGFSGAPNIQLLCLIEIRMVSGQRLLF